jgi:hypothetical protein
MPRSEIPHRIRQILLLAGILWLSWLLMMLVHEGGHVIGALCTGGVVRRVVWHPAVLSRTEVWPNPHPLVEVWAGPVIGCALPLAVAGLASLIRLRLAYLVWVVAGFCLVANGAYIGVGALDPVGDARELVAHGAPRWMLGAFGVVAAGAGIWIWHRVSARLGFGRSPSAISARDAYAVFVVAALVTAIGFLVGDRGV